MLTWNQIYQTIAEALGVEASIVHIPSDFIARVAPELSGSLLGDKTWSVVFDNAKIKAAVPGFEATVKLRDGIRRTAGVVCCRGRAAGRRPGGGGGDGDGAQRLRRSRRVGPGQPSNPFARATMRASPARTSLVRYCAALTSPESSPSRATCSGPFSVHMISPMGAASPGCRW